MATLVFCSATASAATLDWTGATSIDWATASNWSIAAVPGPGDSVTINTITPHKTNLSGGTANVGTITLGSVTAAATFSDLTIDAGAHLAAAQIWDAESHNASSGVTVAHASQLTLSGDFYVGDNGAGGLNINTGASVSNGDAFIAYGANSVSTATVDGNGSTWTSSGNLWVGNAGTGILAVSNGGLVSDDAAYVSSSAIPSYASVTVSDPGSRWKTTNTLAIGDLGGGGLTIDKQGLVTDKDGIVGNQTSGNGQVDVQGGAQWTNTGALSIGHNGTGSVNVDAGSSASANSADLGTFAGANGQLTIDGSGAGFTSATNLSVASAGAAGTGAVVVKNGGTLSVPGEIDLGSGTGNATLTIGSVMGSAAEAPGTVTTTKIAMGFKSTGASVLVFNHTGANYVFAPALGASPGIVYGGFIKAFAGSTNLTADSSGYLGDTVVVGGTLLVNGKLGTGHVTVSSGTLGGSGSIAGPVAVQSGGAIAPGNSPGTLTMGALTLVSGATLDYELAAPGTIGGGVNDLLVVNGNLALGGALNIADAGGFASGTYRLINYTGALSGTLGIGNVPAGFNAAQMQIDTSISGQVNLIVGAAGVPALALTPTNLSWSNVPANGSGGAQSVTLTNTGNAPLTVSLVSLPAAPFVANGGTCPAPPIVLAPNASCTLSYGFDPTAAGSFGSTITTTSNAPSSLATFALGGTAVAAPQTQAAVPAPALAPRSLLLLALLCAIGGVRFRHRRGKD